MDLIRFLIYLLISIGVWIVDSVKYLLTGEALVVRMLIVAIYSGLVVIFVVSKELFWLLIAVAVYLDGISLADNLYKELD